MDRREFLAASSVGVAAAVAGCAGDPLSGTDARPEADGDANASANGGEITVSASGDVDADPDRAIVSVGVRATGGSADAVTDELATGAEELRAAFDDLGIPEENVDEGRYRVQPARGRDADGFEGSHSYEVTVTDVDRVGAVIDASIEAGADDVDQVSFTVGEGTRSTLRKEAIDAALGSADEEAAHIADNRDVELEGTTAVTTDDVAVHPVREEFSSGDAAADEAAPPTEIEADPVSVSASVTVTYSFTE